MAGKRALGTASAKGLRWDLDKVRLVGNRD